MKIKKYLKIIVFCVLLSLIAILLLLLQNKDSYLISYKSQAEQLRQESKEWEKIRLTPSPRQENVEHIRVGVNSDGSLEAVFKAVHSDDKLTFYIESHNPPTVSGNIDPEVYIKGDGVLWEGKIPADSSSRESVVEEAVSVAFSPDGTKIALKAPNQTIHIWKISERLENRPKESSRRRKILWKEFTKIETIPRLEGVFYDDKQGYGSGKVLFSGNSQELYGSFNTDDRTPDTYLLYPIQKKVSNDSYGGFSIPTKSGFGYHKHDKGLNTTRLVHWRNENNQYTYPLVFDEQVISTLIAPDGQKACIKLYSRRMGEWEWRDKREFVGSIDQSSLSEPESRIYNLTSGKELPVRIYPYKCVRWIDKNILLINDGKWKATYYTFNIGTYKMTHLFKEEE